MLSLESIGLGGGRMVSTIGLASFALLYYARVIKMCRLVLSNPSNATHHTYQIFLSEAETWRILRPGCGCGAVIVIQSWIHSVSIIVVPQASAAKPNMSLTPVAPPTTTVRFTGPASCLATTKLHILSGDCLLEQRLAWSSAWPTVTTCSYLVHGPLTSYEGECTQPNPTDASQTLYTSCPAGYTGACTGYFTPEERPWRVLYHVTCCPEYDTSQSPRVP